MRSMAMLMSSLALLSASAGCQPDPAPLSDSHAEAIRDSIAAVLIDFGRHSAEAHWDSVGTFYSDAPSFRFFESGTLQYGSAEEVRAALSGLTTETRFRTEYQDTEVQPLAPGMALVHTLFQTTVLQGSETSFQFGGALTMLWVHEAGGWRILNGHSSAPVPRGRGS